MGYREYICSITLRTPIPHRDGIQRTRANRYRSDEFVPHIRLHMQANSHGPPCLLGDIKMPPAFVSRNNPAANMHLSPATSFRLPDTLAGWPWPRRINPHYAEVKAASAAWLESFHAFGPKAQRAFNLCDFSKHALEVLRTLNPFADLPMLARRPFGFARVSSCFQRFILRYFFVCLAMLT